MSRCIVQALSVLASLALCWNAGAQQTTSKVTFKVLYTDPGTGIGGFPGYIFEGKPGVFYSHGSFMPQGSGSNVFSIDSSGHYKTIYQFPANDSVFWVSAAENGLLYGFGNALQQGGLGWDYFSMKLDGSSLQTYPAAAFGPASAATMSPDGYLYDVMGGPNYTFSRVDLQGIITSLFAFSPGGLQPFGGMPLVSGNSSDFYGLAVVPNIGSKTGWIFKLTDSGVFTKMAPFEVKATGDTTTPLMFASDGNLYGGFAKGGTHRRGSIYRVTPQGQLTTIIDFPATGIAAPAILVEANDGYIYGNTNEVPSFIFRFDPKNPVLETLYQMSSTEGTCGCLFVQGSDGKFYGTAPSGGANGLGTIFTFDAGLTPPKPKLNLISPTTGSPGEERDIRMELKLLADVGLTERGHHYPAQLSGGEQQRVAIARAFANNPKILLADEPTGNLDARNGAHVFNLMLEMNRRRRARNDEDESGATLVLVTHDYELARRADRRIALREGRIVSDETGDMANVEMNEREAVAL